MASNGAIPQAESKPLISVIMPIYNGGAFLEAQMRSVLDQRLEDFEVICVDDGSTDNSVEIVDFFAEQDPRVRRLPSGSNKGQSARLKQLVGNATAEYIAICDQDDEWHPDKLLALFENIGESAMAFGPSELIDEKGNSYGCTLLEALGTSPRPELRLRLLFRSVVSGHAALIRRSLCEGHHFEEGLIFDWSLSLAAAFSEGITFVPQALVFHRLHPAQANNFGVASRLENRMDVVDLLRRVARIGNGRTRLTDAFIAIAKSEAVSPQVRQDFTRLTKLSKMALGEAKGKISMSEFREQAISILKSYAYDDDDLASAKYFLMATCRRVPLPFARRRAARYSML